jgi:hypothetical protein
MFSGLAHSSQQAGPMFSRLADSSYQAGPTYLPGWPILVSRPARQV